MSIIPELSAEQWRLIIEARHYLHSIPELACEEKKTKEFILSFLKANTSLELHDMGRWLYAAHREEAGETIAFRADFDAVPTENGCAAHRCGHDGHTASLLALALMLEGRRVGRSVILLFQHAEEVGVGGKECCELFDFEDIDIIYGCHNIPGEQLGVVLLKPGTFACASCGFQAEFTGKPTHAAYPENGINPTEAIARLALGLPDEAAKLQEEYSAMTISTIVGMYSGERAFGVAAARGALYATLRSENTEALERLISYASAEAERLADRVGVKVLTELYDKFPATVNDESDIERIAALLDRAGVSLKRIDVPFRWSEDFGHYGKHTKAIFFGIGSGTATQPLHTEKYEYPDELAPLTASVFYMIASAGIE